MVPIGNGRDTETCGTSPGFLQMQPYNEGSRSATADVNLSQSEQFYLKKCFF